MPEKAPSFSITQCRNLIGDLFKPNPWIYWTDFLVSYGLGLYFFQKVRGGSLFVPHQGFQGTWQQALYFLLSCLLFYRAAMFIHEVVHQRTTGRLKVFRFVWNALCGIPFLMPSFVYYTHIDHHRRKHYGTDQDGEYLPLEHRGVLHTLLYLSQSFVIPLLAIIRFLILTPLAWIVPGFRKFVHQHASSMVIDPTYIRPMPKKQTMRIIYLQEFFCFLWCAGIAVVPAVFMNRLPIPFLVHAYLMAVVIIMINALRTIGAHRYNSGGRQMTFLEQLLDSVNYPRRPWITEIWGPVGTRFHALHHLFPSLPYHAFPKAHRRLMAGLPADSPYRLTEEPSLTSGLIDLFQRIAMRRRGLDPSVVGRRKVAASMPGDAQHDAPAATS